MENEFGQKPGTCGIERCNEPAFNHIRSRDKPTDLKTTVWICSKFHAWMLDRYG